jgi:glycosyltransferase involved in cell wall biosynthesis
LGRTRYDFVYGHGSLGTAGVIAARRVGIPCGQRLYGTFMSRDIAVNRPSSWQKGWVFLRHPLEYMAYSLPKSFLLITNDGSRGNLVFQAIGHQRTDLHFWLNGVERELQDAQPAALPFPPGTPYLLYPARIEPWKQQHLAIELLGTLKSELGITVRLVFAGHEDDTGYARQLRDRAGQAGIADLVAFLGPVPMSSMPALYAGSLAVLSFYSVCNLGNVAIEALSSGCALISLADGSLDGIVEHTSSGFLVSDMHEAAAAVGQLLADPRLRERVGQAAMQSTREHFLPWRERAARELALIDGAVHAARGRAHA